MEYFDIPNMGMTCDEYAERQKQDDVFMKMLRKRETQMKIRQGYDRLLDKWQAIINQGDYTPAQFKTYIKVGRHWFRHRNMYGNL